MRSPGRRPLLWQEERRQEERVVGVLHDSDLAVRREAGRPHARRYQRLDVIRIHAVVTPVLFDGLRDAVEPGGARAADELDRMRLPRG